MIWLYLSVGLYVAPEIYKGDLFDRSVDAYSFGLIVYEVPIFFNTHNTVIDVSYLISPFFKIVFLWLWAPMLLFQGPRIEIHLFNALKWKKVVSWLLALVFWLVVCTQIQVV
jgi:hypothetical protein